MLKLSISYPHLIKCPHFADITERGGEEAKAEEIGGEREGDFMDNSIVYGQRKHFLVVFMSQS
jgi:hypothetical protein